MDNLNKLIEQINNDLGAAPSEIKSSDKIQRFDVEKKNDKAGWISYKDWNYNGKDYAAATYNSWKSTDVNKKWTSWTKQEEREDKFFRKAFKELNETTEKQLIQEALEKKEEILSHFNHFQSLKEDNFYLKKKQFSTRKGLLQDKYQNLIVPIYEDLNKNLAGYQRILDQESFNKQYPSGQHVQGNFFFFGNPKVEDYIYLCEGLATAATVYEVTGIATVCCFQANNIPPVVKKLKHELNGIKIIIAADNDHFKKQTGLFYAKKAKDKSGNIGIVLPTFPKDSKLTDFNDYFVTQGEEETRKALTYDESKFVEVEFLGYDNSKYYFYSTRTKDIRAYPTVQLKSGILIETALESYWAQKYTPIIDKEGEPTENCNWKKTTEKIIAEQNKVGMYNDERVRGIGTWIDRENHVINTGEELLINGEKANFGKNKSLKYFYIPSIKGEVLKISEPKMSYDFSPLIEAMDLTDFKSDRDRILVCGYLALAQIFTTQRWRPNIWVRADRGTGKSSLLEFCRKLLMNSEMIQDTTSAGLRQNVGPDSRICLVDEAEGESYKTKQLVEMARHSSSGGDSKIFRGTVNGTSLQYKPNLTFFFASIRAAELDPADKSRIMQVSMKKRSQVDLERNRLRAERYQECYDLSEDLFKYMNDHLDKFEAEKKDMVWALTQLGLHSREADQYSPILTAYHMINPRKPLPELVKLIAESVKSEGDEDLSTDQYDFYDVFMSLIIRDQKDEFSIRQVLETKYKEKPSYWSFVLERYGICHLPKKDAYFVVENNNMKNLFKKNTKFKNYFDQMKDSIYFERSKQKFLKKGQWGYLVLLK